MIDVNALLYAWLTSKTPVVNHFTGGIVASLEAPSGYVPASGPLLLFSPRSGSFISQDGVTVRYSYQIQFFGLNTSLLRQGERILFDEINNGKCGRILQVSMDTAGILIYLEETKWPAIITYYNVFVVVT